MPDHAPAPQADQPPRRAVLLPAGLVPLYLSAEEAAAFLGVSPRTFADEVANGWWPSARRRGAKGGRLTWYRPALEAAAAALHAPTGAAQTSPTVVDEAVAAEQAALAGLEKSRRATSP